MGLVLVSLQAYGWLLIGVAEVWDFEKNH